MIHDVMKNLIKERPVGSKNNLDILLYLKKLMVDMGYEVEKITFERVAVIAYCQSRMGVGLSE